MPGIVFLLAVHPSHGQCPSNSRLWVLAVVHITYIPTSCTGTCLILLPVHQHHPFSNCLQVPKCFTGWNSGLLGTFMPSATRPPCSVCGEASSPNLFPWHSTTPLLFFICCFYFSRKGTRTISVTEENPAECRCKVQSNSKKLIPNSGSLWKILMPIPSHIALPNPPHKTNPRNL